jgi:hypothetical protein
MRRIATLAVLLFAGAGNAQTLYKCVSRDMTSYQQTPCPATARTVRSIHTVPEPPPTPAQRAEQRRKAQHGRAESAFLSHLAGTDQFRSTSASVRRTNRTNRRDKQEAACEAAQRSRERTLQAVGLRRNLDLLRKLDDNVADACRGR